MKLYLPACTALVLAFSPVWAGPVTYLSGTYQQDFNTLNQVGNNKDWLTESTANGTAGPPDGWHIESARDPEQITADDGGNNNDEVYSLGYHPGDDPVNAFDRALGAHPGPSGEVGIPTPVSYGLQLVNGSGFTLDTFVVTYDGEQWRVGDNYLGNITVDYQIFDLGTGSLSVASGWTPISNLTFTSPTTVGNNAKLDGNAPGNRTANITETVVLSGAAWGNNKELWIRWTDIDDNGSHPSDHTLGIDNVRFSAIREPSAALLGALALGFGLVRRRRAA